MTKEQLNTSIDTVFDDNIPDNSLSPSMVGAKLKEVANFAELQVPYKSYVGVLEINNSDTPSGTTIFNNLCTSISWVKNNTGFYIGTIVGGTFTQGKTFIPNRRYCLFTSSTPLNVYLQASGTNLSVSFNDGNAAIKGTWIEFEVRVYN